MSGARITPPSCPIARFAPVHIALVFAVLSGCALSEQGINQSPKRVLILYSFDNEEGIYSGFDRELRSDLRSGVPDRVELYAEYLDLVRFPAPAYAGAAALFLESSG